VTEDIWAARPRVITWALQLGSFPRRRL
jgi:hypothetical protein